MKPAFRSIRSGLHVVGVVAALTFGASQAFANNPPEFCTVSTAWGTCHSQAECDYFCSQVPLSEGAACNISTSCCYCIM